MNNKRTTIGSIPEVHFGYTTKLEGYPYLTADITELYEIARKRANLKKDET
jgi:hypothetical protein